ncbi:MAG: HDOD domain-containing protein, partial [Planctomycetes bacterium]|nr:HDOD domain-containing protein [Planctomycetota bacterium]
MERSTTHRILKSIDDIGKLPPTISKVLEVTNNAAASPRDLATVIKYDPVLTFEILKLINSAFYSLRNEVTNLTQAVVLLGMTTVKNLCLSIALAQKLTVHTKSSVLSPQRFWEHSIRVAIAARLVAANAMKPPSKAEDFFIAGLLHDMGKLVLTNLLPQEYENMLITSAQRNTPLTDLESANFGITHSEVGAKIGEKWNFSPGFIDAVLGHHNKELGESQFRKVQVVVAVANYYVHKIDDAAQPPPGAPGENGAAPAPAPA